MIYMIIAVLTSSHRLDLSLSIALDKMFAFI